MVDFSDDDFEIEVEKDDEEVTVQYDIASYPSDYTLYGISQMWHEGDIEIPDYQREFVWGIKQSSLLIDSFLTGLPVPPVFLYIDDQNRSLVIDGQQRILSIVFFLEGYFGKESTHGKRQVFRLTGLGKGNPHNGKKFKDLPEMDQRKLKQAVLRAINIRQLSPVGESTSAYHIFERLNTGGTPLVPQEIRNSVFRGQFNSLLKELNTDINWRSILGRPNLDKRQRDVELLLRIFSLVGSSDKYDKPMKEFLNTAMKKHQNGLSSKVSSFVETFPKVTKLLVDAVGEKPFHLRGPINVSALDSIMSVLIESSEDLDLLDIKAKYDEIVKDESFLQDTSVNTTDNKTVQSRFAKVRQILLS